jgi:23S rRNA (cytidine2498-2'-O)-methyltransferase
MTASEPTALPGRDLGACAYVADPGFVPHVREDLVRRGAVEEPLPGLFILPGPPVAAPWARQVWFGLRRLAVPSINAAVRDLKRLAPWWSLLPGAEYRRSRLILEQLRHDPETPRDFPLVKAPRSGGAFTLLARDEALVATATDRPFAGGLPVFTDDRTGPPSRAYKKLYEALTLLGRAPGPGARVLELGAAPGAWTWTLTRLGARVDSIDRSPLDPRVAALPGVHHRQGDAFAIDPADGPWDWLCSDVVCYPSRLIALIDRWLAHGHTQNFVITVKFQGAPDPADIRAFQSLPGVLVHLGHNKHELTWLRHAELPFDPWPRPWPWIAGSPART